MAQLPATFLALPGGGEQTSATIRRKVRLLAVRALLTYPAATLPGALAGSVARAQAVLERTLRDRGRQVLAAVGSQDVLPFALALHGHVLPAADLLGQGMPNLLAALAHPDGLAEAVLWEHPVDRLVVAGAAADVAARAMVADPGGVELELADRSRHPVTFADGATPLPGGVHLSLVDSNPLAMLEEHPEKSGNAVSLGGHSLQEWVDALTGALSLVADGLPTWFADLSRAQDRLIPVGFEAERHLSASYREAPGLCYLTLHPDVLTLAEAVVHETQHSKLNALSWLDPVLENGRSTWTTSPVRPDLRPLMGVLLAVHAFVPVAALHHALLAAGHPVSRTDRFRRRRAEVLAGNARGLQLIHDLGAPTAIGARVVAALADLHQVVVREASDVQLDAAALPPG